MIPAHVSKIENIRFEHLKGFEKAAILINYLGSNAAQLLFQHLEDSDIRKLISIMSRFRVIPVGITKRVLEEFYENFHLQLDICYVIDNFPFDLLKQLLTHSHPAAQPK